MYNRKKRKIEKEASSVNRQTIDEAPDGYLPQNEAERKEEERFSSIEKKYKEMYGRDMSKWSVEIKDQMDKEMFGDL